MQPLLRPTPTLHGLALAAALVCTGASAGTVDVTAANAFGAPGGNAVIDIDLGFAGPYRLDNLRLRVDFDPLALAWDRPASSLTFLGATRPLDTAVTLFNSQLIARASITPGTGSFELGLRFYNPPPLTDVVTVRAAFTLLSPAMDHGAWSDVHISGLSVEQTTVGALIDTPFAATARINTVAAVPEPGAAWMLAAGLAGLAALARRRRAGRPAA